MYVWCTDVWISFSVGCSVEQSEKEKAYSSGFTVCMIRQGMIYGKRRIVPRGRL